jgi:hypothetical protein
MRPVVSINENPGMKFMRTFFAIIISLVSLQAFSQNIDITRQWRLNIGDTLNWASSSYDDSHWKLIEEINRFEAEGFSNFQDFGWARKTFFIPSTMKEATDKVGYFYVSLGRIFDADEVFFNGKLVGSSGTMPPDGKLVERGKRIYKVPGSNILWDKENLIAIRVFSNFRNGGLQGEHCAIIIPSEEIFHLSQKAIPSFPLENSQQSYEAVTSLAHSQELEIRDSVGLVLKISLPKDASVFYNRKYIGKSNLTGEQSFFVPALFISSDNKDKITVYLDSRDALKNILFAAPRFEIASANAFNLMQVSNLNIKKGSLKGNSSLTASVKVFNSTNVDFTGKLTLAFVTDISNVQQSASQSIHLDKLQKKEFDFVLKPNFFGVYELNYILERGDGEKITGTLAKGERF